LIAKGNVLDNLRFLAIFTSYKITICAAYTIYLTTRHYGHCCN